MKCDIMVLACEKKLKRLLYGTSNFFYLFMNNRKTNFIVVWFIYFDDGDIYIKILMFIDIFRLILFEFIT